MNEWEKVDVPTQFPMRCTSCQNARDLLDTLVELPGGWRVYYCKECARRGARAFGFSKGKEQERLSRAAVEIEEVTKERDDYKRLYENEREEKRDARAQSDSLATENEFLRGRLNQLTERLSGEGKALLELVGGDAA